jgi:hypothetical protein
LQAAGTGQDVSFEPMNRPTATAPTNSTRKIPNRILAIEAEACSTPVKPKIPATIAMIRKTPAH